MWETKTAHWSVRQVFSCRLILASDLESNLIPKDLWTGQRNKMRFNYCSRAFSLLNCRTQGGEHCVGIWSLNPYLTSFCSFTGTLRNFLWHHLLHLLFLADTNGKKVRGREGSRGFGRIVYDHVSSKNALWSTPLVGDVVWSPWPQKNLRHLKPGSFDLERNRNWTNLS